MTHVRAVAVACVAGSLLGLGSARADTTARLTYSRTRDASACPDEGTARTEVARRLGYDPFSGGAGKLVVFALSRVDGAYRGVVRVEDAAGAPLGAREVTGVACDDVVAALALSTSVILDPMAGKARPAAPPPAPAPEPPAPPEERPDPPELGARPRAVAAPPRPEIRARAGAFGGVSAWSAPSPVPLLAAAIGAVSQSGRRRLWSTDLELRVDLTSAPTDPPHGARSSLVLGAVVPCARVAPLDACLVVGAGALRGQVDDAISETRQSSFFAAVGPRVALDVPLGPLALIVRADALVPLTPTTLRAGKQDAWATPPISLAISAGLAGLL